MQSPVRFALVGAGRIAQSYMAAFAGCEQAALVGVMDTQPDAASALGAAAGCPSFTSLEEMVQTADPEVAIVAVPPVCHEAAAKALLGQGVHVLCEKPFAIDSGAAARMVSSAREAGRIVTMASKFRYVDDVERAKSMVASGLLGDPILFENTFAARVDMSRRWNSEPKISGGGVLIDNGCHSVDLVRYLIGPVTRVSAVECMRVHGLGVEETVQLCLQTESGTLGSVSLSWSIQPEKSDYLRVHGSEGTLVVGWEESKWRAAASPAWTSFGNGYDKVRAFRRQLANVAGAVRGREELLIDARDAVASVAVIETAYEAMRRGEWVPVPSLAGNGHLQHATHRAGH